MPPVFYYSAALALGHCVTLYPAVELLETVFFIDDEETTSNPQQPNENTTLLLPPEKPRRAQPFKSTLRGAALRLSCVCLTVAGGFAVPSFERFSNLVGR